MDSRHSWHRRRPASPQDSVQRSGLRESLLTRQAMLPPQKLLWDGANGGAVRISGIHGSCQWRTIKVKSLPREWSVVLQGVCSSTVSLSKTTLSLQQHGHERVPSVPARSAGVNINRSGCISTLLMNGLALTSQGSKSLTPQAKGGASSLSDSDAGSSHFPHLHHEMYNAPVLNALGKSRS